MTMQDRITFNPKQCGERPCIQDVLELLADGLSPEEVVKQLPDLELEDVRASLEFAAKRVGHPTLTVTTLA
jgi:uncharacterized protein (DUF433 family)